MLLKPKHQVVTVDLYLTVVTILSLMIRNMFVSSGTVIQALFNFDSESDLHDVITGARALRTIITLLTGAAFAVSGLLMQTLARNLMASSGLFGANAGAAFFVIFSITFVQIQSSKMIVAIALLGTIVVTALVVALGIFRQTLFSPHRAISAGAAIAMLFIAFI